MMTMAGRVVALVAAALLLLTSGTSGTGPPAAEAVAPSASPAPSGPPAPQRLRVEVLSSQPHDPTASTQGLEYHAGLLYESTGGYGQSDLRVVRPRTGAVLRRVPLPAETFGEGITLVGDTVWQLTYQEGTAFRRSRADLGEQGRVTYPGEGWGLCHDPADRRLVQSDGSDLLTFRDPETFAVTGGTRVRRDARPVRSINELECAGGRVWANLWTTDQIVRIDPATGLVDAVVDASGLLTAAEQAAAAELNGIAAVDCAGTFIITGKLWPRTFTVRFVPVPG